MQEQWPNEAFYIVRLSLLRNQQLKKGISRLGHLSGRMGKLCRKKWADWNEAFHLVEQVRVIGIKHIGQFRHNIVLIQDENILQPLKKHQQIFPTASCKEALAQLINKRSIQAFALLCGEMCSIIERYQSR